MPVPEYLKRQLTLYEIAEQFWDLNYIPSKYVFSLLASVSEHELERDKCIELCSPEGQDDLLNYCRRPRRTILEVLQDFHRSTSKLTIDIIFELFSPIKPRSYSIASSSKYDSHTMELLVAVVNYYSKLKKPRLGLCSNWLKKLKAGDGIYGWFKSGTLVFPEDQNTPCILIGPGTGLAPFRGYILERSASGTARADTLFLFFGCRYEGKDFHCRRQLRGLHDGSELTLVCAFSRDQERKIYVQHKIAEHRDHLWQLIKERRAVVFISGSSKNMPDSVKEAFVQDVFVKAGGMEPTAAENMMNEMESGGRLQMETW